MTKSDWVDVCGSWLQAQDVKDFSALEICDVGRESYGTRLSAPPLELLKNAVIGGAPNSLHMTLGAADVVKVGRTPAEVADLLEDYPEKNLLGVGRYRTFTHVDVRGMIGRSSPARWG